MPRYNLILAKILTVFVIFFFSTSIPLFTQSYNFIHDELRSIDGNTVAEEMIWKQVNLERKKTGLQELSYDSSLQSAARQHSQEMLKLGYFSHTSPLTELKNPSDRVYRAGLSDFVVGENIAVHSLDGPPDVVASQLMEQWMNSPGHRANILRPEFTHIGIGVISSKDSTVRDTLIKGKRARRVVYSIRHYGTQVFTSRSLTFSELTLSRKESEFLIFDLECEYDREMLASFDNYTQFFHPSGNRIRIHVEVPMRPLIQIYLARIQNEYTQEYIAFFLDEFVAGNIVKTMDKLNEIPFPVINKEVRTEKKFVFFLDGEAALAKGDTTLRCMIHVDNDRYYELDPVHNKIRFRIPVETNGKVKKISIAIGGNKEKLVANQIMIDASWLDKEAGKDVQQKVFMKK